ncbi:hypothetical protein LUZ61_020530 [Rhynchospora tenuis]|uniref:Aminotransferase-like plant mobile domain-containing protein n=1 Tax=Rhynchospora tenuis TaxID=198213 RepID=A0AAD6EP47_9POAL|nr:hypothetical protein LUZ61_020530 [Rhynchospora tenuis]
MWEMHIEAYLGITPDVNAMANKSALKLSWLRTKFGSLRPDATNLEVQQHFRAYLLCVLGSFLMTDLTGDSVPCMYLRLLIDVDNIGSYSWGSAILAKMYRMLCHACKKNAKQIAGPIPLMQMWAYERFKIGRPIVLSRVPEYLPPRGFYWSKRHEWKKRKNKCTLQDYRKMLDLIQDEDVEWTPYDISIRSILPPTCMAGHENWLSMAPLIDFNIVEKYRPDRVMRQFDKFQVIPPPARSTLPDAHKVDRRMYPTEDWLVYHSEHVAAWKDRWKLIIDEARPYDHQSHPAYMAWYNAATIPTFSSNIGLHANRELEQERLGSPRATMTDLVSEAIQIPKDFARKYQSAIDLNRGDIKRLFQFCRNVVDTLDDVKKFDSLCPQNEEEEI